MKFEKRVIGRLVNDQGNGAMNTFCTIGDLNGDGYPDFVVSGRNGKMVWLENPGDDGEWIQHEIDDVRNMECGGCVFDVDGDGFPDIINGSDGGARELFWWKNPGLSGRPWVKYLICRTEQCQFHDVLVGDIKNDGQPHVVFTNQQGGTTIRCVRIPENPTVEPWPEMEVIAEGMSEPNPHNPAWNPSGLQPEEGLALGDIDGDGKNELVCGMHWYRHGPDGWTRHRYAADYISTKVLVCDVDGDGRNEIVTSEGDAWIYGKKCGCKLAWFKPADDVHALWKEHILETGLLDAHTLEAADLCGNGHMDLLVGEIGAFDWEKGEYVIRTPRLMIYENDGTGCFPVRHMLDVGTGIHEGRLVDLTGSGNLDVIGKPLHGAEKWNLHAYFQGGT
jgi:hypothetical protein